MTLQDAIDLYVGGPGSGCNPEVGKCGRPPGKSVEDKPFKFKNINGVVTAFPGGIKVELHKNPGRGAGWNVVVAGKEIATFKEKSEAKLAVKADPDFYTRGAPTGGKQAEPAPKPSKSTRTGNQDDVRALFQRAMGGASYSEELMGKHFVQGAIRHIGNRGIDTRLLSQTLRMGTRNYSGRPVNGEYSPHTATIYLATGKALETRTVVHEFGHHIDALLFYDSGRWDGYGALHRSLPWSEKGESQAIRDADDSHIEWREAVNKVAKRENIPVERLHWYDVHDFNGHSVSAYALHNDLEWFAESFSHYYGNNVQHENLKVTVPATYKLIDNIVKGKYFK